VLKCVASCYVYKMTQTQTSKMNFTNEQKVGFIIALHGMQTRLAMRILSVCPSVCHTRVL